MTKYTAQYDNFTFDFDYVKATGASSKYALDFMLNGKVLYQMAESHKEYKDALKQLKELGALSAIVIKH